MNWAHAALGAGGALLGLVAGLYFLGLYTAAQAERDFPPIGTFVTVEGQRIHVLDRGTGPAVVLIHGLSGNLRDFTSSLVEPLSQSHRVLAFDRPGIGYSERPGGAWCDPLCQARLIHGAVQAMGVSRAVILGHSWGGAVAMAYGLAYPDEVQGVLDLAGATHPWTTGASWYYELAGKPIIGPLFVNLFAVPLGRQMAGSTPEGVFRPNSAPEGFRAALGLDLLFRPASFTNNASDDRNLSAFLAQQRMDYPNFKPRLTIVTGADDPIVPPWNHARRLKAEVAQAELIEVPGIGHMPHYMATDQVIAAINKLWAE